MNFKERLAFFQKQVELQQKSINSNYCLPQTRQKKPVQQRNITKIEHPCPKVITPHKQEPKKDDQTDIASKIAFFRKNEEQDTSTQSPLKKEAQNTTKSSGNRIASKIAFYQNQGIKNNQPTQLQETPKNSKPSSKFSEKLGIYNKLKVPLGQPTDYTKRHNSNCQENTDNQPQMVFPTELLTMEKEEVENEDMSFRRPVRYMAGRRRPTNLPDN